MSHRRSRQQALPRLALPLVVIALLTPSVAYASAAEAAAPARLIVGFHAMPRGLDVGGAYEGAPIVFANPALAFVVVETSDRERFEARASRDSNVAYVEEDRYEQWVQFTPNDPRLGSQYGPQQVRAPEAWDETLGDTDRNVCIVDTGVRYTHEDLAGARWLGGYDYVNNDNNPWDDQGHGTHVAGIAAAGVNNGKGIAGIANVGIKGVKVLSSSGSGYHSWIASGIQWCADNEGHIVSLSLGGSGSSTVSNAVDYAWSRGALLVAAAGNDGPCSNCILYPAAYDKVVAVACTTSSKGQCYFSSEGPQMDLAAPGYDILSTGYGSDTQYVYKSGTSMAAPAVSGVAGLVWSRHPHLTAAEVRKLLEETAQDVGASGWDVKFGHGIVDARAALDKAVPLIPQQPVYVEDFDDGAANGWTLSGLWRVDSRCKTPPSSPRYAGYHVSGACHYDNLFSNSGSATFKVDLADAIQATLVWNETWEVEQSSTEADVMTVSVSKDGSSWTTLRTADSRTPNQATWKQSSLVVNSYVGGTLHVRFHFDTKDSFSNGHDGWYLDDVTVTAATNWPPEARAGADITRSDADASGAEVVPLDGSASKDVDGSVASYRWLQGDTLLATGAFANVSLPVGQHTIVLEVTDNEGAVDTDVLVATVLANKPPIAAAGADKSASDADGDGSASVSLSGAGSSDPDGVLVAYEWSANGAVLSTAVAPTLTLAVGTHDITLRVTDNGGATASDVVRVTVTANIAPTAALAVTCTDLACTLSGGGSSDADGTLVQYAWDLGDGATAVCAGGTCTFSHPDRTTGSGSGVKHTYAASGTYTVVLTVTDNGGATASASRVISPPFALSFQEDFDDGVADGWSNTGLWHVSKLCTPAAPTAPNYLGFHLTSACSLRTYYSNTGTATVTTDLTLTPNPVLRYDTRWYNDGSMYVRARESGTSTWYTLKSWSGASGNDATNWVRHEVDLGTYAGKRMDLQFYFYRSYAYAGEVGWFLDNVTVAGSGTFLPVARAGVDQTHKDSDGDGVQPVTLDGSASSDRDGFITAWTWMKDGAVLAEGAVVDLLMPVGTHTITLVVTDDQGATASDTLVVTVLPNAAPIAEAGTAQTLQDADGTGAETARVNGSASRDPDGTLVTYEWLSGATLLASDAVADIALAVGTHTLTLRVTDNGGMTASDTVVITVEANRPPVVSAANAEARDTDGTGAERVALSATALDPDGTIAAIEWVKDGAVVATGSSPTVSFGIGTHNLTVRATDNGGAVGTAAAQVVVHANRAPLAVLNATCYDLICSFDARASSDPDGTPLSYAWNLGDGTTASGAEAARDYAAPGDYTVTLTVTDAGNGVAVATKALRLKIEPPRQAPRAPVANPHVPDSYRDVLGDSGATPWMDVQSAWFEADLHRVYVGMKLKDLTVSAGALGGLYEVSFLPTWSVADPTWGGAVPAGATLEALRVARWAEVDGAAVRTYPELQAVVRHADGTRAITTVATVQFSFNANSGIFWWVVPRDVLQSPPEGAVLARPTASSSLSGLGVLQSPTRYDVTGIGRDYEIRRTVGGGGTYEAFSFTTSSEGFVRGSDRLYSEVRWDPVGGNVLVVANRMDPANEILARPLETVLTPNGPSFNVTARWRVEEQGNWQGVFPLFVGQSGQHDLRHGANTLTIQYDSRDRNLRQPPIYWLRYIDDTGTARLNVPIGATLADEHEVRLTYDAPTKTLRLTLAKANGAIVGTAAYVVGTSPNDGFRFDRIGVATHGWAGSFEAYARGRVDDVTLSIW